MSQLSGAFTVEVDVDRFAEKVADRVLARLHNAAAQATGGSLTYEREPDPEPSGPLPPRGTVRDNLEDDEDPAAWR